MTETIQLKSDDQLSPRIRLLYGMWTDTREMLLRTIKGLTIEELDFTPDDRTVESIATLLVHIAGVEWSWIFEDIDGQEMEYEKWKWAFALRKGIEIPQISGHEVSYYLDLLQEVRDDVYLYLREINDDKLDQVIEVDGYPHTIEWILYHVFEHELTHIGQIRLLKRLFKLQA